MELDTLGVNTTHSLMGALARMADHSVCPSAVVRCAVVRQLLSVLQSHEESAALVRYLPSAYRVFRRLLRDPSHAVCVEVLAGSCRRGSRSSSSSSSSEAAKTSRRRGRTRRRRQRGPSGGAETGTTREHTSVVRSSSSSLVVVEQKGDDGDDGNDNDADADADADADVSAGGGGQDATVATAARFGGVGGSVFAFFLKLDLEQDCLLSDRGVISQLLDGFCAGATGAVLRLPPSSSSSGHRRGRGNRNEVASVCVAARTAATSSPSPTSASTGTAAAAAADLSLIHI